MERIVLEVDDTVGKMYKAFSKESKQNFNQTISMMVKKAANEVNYTKYTDLLDATGTEAIKNGLTPEILEALLASND